MTSLPSACCCTPEYPEIASWVQRERTKGNKRMSGNSSHGSKCNIHLAASTASMKRERLVGDNRNYGTQQVAPTPSPLFWGQTVPPFVPQTTSSKAHEGFHYPPTVVCHCVSSHIFLILGLILLPQKRREKRIKTQVSNSPNKPKVSCPGRRRHQAHSALQSRSFLVGLSKVNTPKTQVLHLTWWPCEICILRKEFSGLRAAATSSTNVLIINLG